MTTHREGFESPAAVPDLGAGPASVDQATVWVPRRALPGSEAAERTVTIPRFARATRAVVDADQARPAAGKAPEKIHGATAWLDGVRGLAAMFVVLHHCWLIVFPGFPRNSGPWYVGWLLYGHLAVVVFIVLSGYSLALAPAANGHRLKGGWRTFARRRAWRILPPYWAALAISVPVAIWVTHSVSGTGAGIRAFFVHFSMLQIVVDTERPNGTFWSIAVEVWIYFLFPLLLLLRRRLGPVAMAGVTVVVVCGLKVALAHTPMLATKYGQLSPQMLACFALGVLAADSARAPRIAGRRVPLLGLAGLLIAACVAGFTVVGSEDIVNNYFWVDVLVGVVTAVAFRGLAAAPTSRLRGVLAARPLTTLGMFAFSIYLIHVLILETLWFHLVQDLASGMAALAVIMALTIPTVLVVSYGFFKLFEAPFLRARSWADVRALRGRAGGGQPVPHRVA
ncbi:Peptidoglycan/LPS O-acetylase OafA/YrhL, contains acyltransferase and SGNH-hydrolase domains [Parafrankia irregularis]|uniref:Peptidoglycan/LPS O-acetylase OafA/YrhL, contains acyltransferase and SGNH-hydrolase domains n=1 Tax=Parafrankia irregularis TaxID=795642 RepID=A0A0S4QSK9_9ACTN|nr:MULTISPECIES: acyltransferase [Parafrankia]MBE3204999.1 acyltransferase [Parafrankia sp. CH37]CUU58525.1 Peptidoglycan/LPS O-acetylase OafA/YrhL, contains acyltransferase and SGNH-hydrolase domains [Parafrankia irregularis]